MCGITGIVDLSGRPVRAGLLRAMNERVRHRGPDDEGFVVVEPGSGEWRAFAGPASPAAVRAALPPIEAADSLLRGSVALGHRRYSIIDLSPGGHQPLFDAGGRCCVVFNGEIYNYVEVRGKLEALGAVFRTGSDTEVIVEAYRRWGTECFAELNGMWALALYDFERRRVVLSRDRLGKLPLYWARHGETVYFASEIKSLLAVPELRSARSVNEAAVAPYLLHGLRDVDGETFFRGVHTLPAGSWAVVDHAFPASATRFWTVPGQRLREADVGADEAARRVRDLLEDSVRIRMRADVPWCVELSGGLDSSALVALSSRAAGAPVTTFTVRFPEKEWNEEEYARAVAERYGVDYRVIDSPVDNFWSEILRFTYLQEEPYHAPNLHTNQVIRRTMRAEGFKMILNGAAGDELFAGYGAYYNPYQRQNLAGGRLGTYVRAAVQRSESDRVLRSLASPLVSWARDMGTWLAGPRAAGVHGYLPGPLPRMRSVEATLHRQLYQDITRTKLPYWMRSGDKMTMGIPMESRAPFLDYRLVETAFTLPTGYLIRGGWHKWILRKALEDVLPADVVWRRVKMGFPFPWERFFDESRGLLMHLVRSAENPYVDTSRPELLLRNWRAVSFLLWYELFFNDRHALLEEMQAMAAAGQPPVDYGFVPEYLSDPVRYPAAAPRARPAMAGGA
jgi:asparagine synthase (glutamine-hydrolysing)